MAGCGCSLEDEEAKKGRSDTILLDIVKEELKEFYSRIKGEDRKRESDKNLDFVAK